MKNIDIAKFILLSIFTFGIYSLIWYWQTMNALASEAGEDSTPIPAAVQFILIFFGVGSYIFGYCADAEMTKIRTNKGLPVVDNKILWIVLGLVPLIQTILIQMSINEITPARA